MIERFGTGIRRINDLYSQSSTKPKFIVTSNTISVTLPVLSKEPDISPDEKQVYKLLAKKSMSSGAITGFTGFGKNKTVSILNRLVDKGYIQKEGSGRGIKYRV